MYAKIIRGAKTLLFKGISLRSERKKVLSIMYLFLFNSYHLGSGLYAKSDAVRIAGVSVRKVQDLDLEILSILCEVRSYDPEHPV